MPPDIRRSVPLSSQSAKAVEDMMAASERLPWSEAEEELLIREAQKDGDFDRIIETFRTMFHPTRTAAELEAHFSAMERDGFIPEGSSSNTSSGGGGGGSAAARGKRRKKQASSSSSSSSSSRDVDMEEADDVGNTVHHLFAPGATGLTAAELAAGARIRKRQRADAASAASADGAAADGSKPVSSAPLSSSSSSSAAAASTAAHSTAACGDERAADALQAIKAAVESHEAAEASVLGMSYPARDGPDEANAKAAATPAAVPVRARVQEPASVSAPPPLGKWLKSRSTPMSSGSA